MSAYPKILFFDIETSPILAYTFSLFKPMIGLDQIVERPRVICWSAMWGGTRKVLFRSEYHDDRDTMLREMRDLLDEADIVVGYNSTSFDVPWLNGEFAKEKIERPSPFQQVDLWRVNKSAFRLASGKLDFLAWHLLEERKVSHTGFRLWADCIGTDEVRKEKAWRLMKRYALQDTRLLPPLYEALLPYITNVNMALYSGDLFACTGCSSRKLERRGFKYTTAGKYQRYQCLDCGSWSSDSKRDDTTRLRALK
jgi:uncharacterized protein YprB with RNaseH-like and TPR domain